MFFSFDVTNVFSYKLLLLIIKFHFLVSKTLISDDKNLKKKKYFAYNLSVNLPNLMMEMTLASVKIIAVGKVNNHTSHRNVND